MDDVSVVNGEKPKVIGALLDKSDRRILADVQHKLQLSQDRRITASEILRLALRELASKHGIAI